MVGSTRDLHRQCTCPRVVVSHIEFYPRPMWQRHGPRGIFTNPKKNFMRGLPRGMELSTLREPSLELAFLPTRLRHWFTRASMDSEGFHVP
ncbi:hypothetical protein H5410_041482 [Solanum commersonii]|uniref:Uncharacterized protein n=1 Tax=Solanum commersonii TaxID=4109 RepID=A0A9J5XUW4_SOLCO|nr:hypothetical protein H5410_041482 [Solanum commersonii]